MCGDDSPKKIQILEKKLFHFFFHLFFDCYYCPINLKRQSEHSGLGPNTSSLVVPTFDTKVTEYLCSGWVFFSLDKFRLFNRYIFDRIFLYHSKGIVDLSLNLKIYLSCHASANDNKRANLVRKFSCGSDFVSFQITYWY